MNITIDEIRDNTQNKTIKLKLVSNVASCSSLFSRKLENWKCIAPATKKRLNFIIIFWSFQRIQCTRVALWKWKIRNIFSVSFYYAIWFVTATLTLTNRCYTISSVFYIWIIRSTSTYIYSYICRTTFSSKYINFCQWNFGRDFYIVNEVKAFLCRNEIRSKSSKFVRLRMVFLRLHWPQIRFLSFTTHRHWFDVYNALQFSHSLSYRVCVCVRLYVCVSFIFVG